ncbi:hypothetical protein KEM56_002780 [Ascosphaera pollenicola]|nr:hypothetical protein KEM56_002780 [Ascosphaera pollenicola]
MENSGDESVSGWYITGTPPPPLQSQLSLTTPVQVAGAVGRRVTRSSRLAEAEVVETTIEEEKHEPEPEQEQEEQDVDAEGEIDVEMTGIGTSIIGVEVEKDGDVDMEGAGDVDAEGEVDDEMGAQVAAT